MNATDLPTWIGILAGMALLPFLLTMVTSFAKLVIVFGMIRQALGTQQIPPNTVITGIALILTVHVMYPVVERSIEAYEAPAQEAGEFATVQAVVDASREPLSSFLESNADESHLALFSRLRTRLGASPDESPLLELFPEGEPRTQAGAVVDLFTITAPAFVLTELTEAFQIGFLIFIPFLIIDLVVSNILLAMGMHMMSPITITLPLKLLLFVLIGGWELILTGLVMGYV